MAKKSDSAQHEVSSHMHHAPDLTLITVHTAARLMTHNTPPEPTALPDKIWAMWELPKVITVESQMGSLRFPLSALVDNPLCHSWGSVPYYVMYGHFKVSQIWRSRHIDQWAHWSRWV